MQSPFLLPQFLFINELAYVHEPWPGTKKLKLLIT